jgi:hypothetical protein
LGAVVEGRPHPEGAVDGAERHIEVVSDLALAVALGGHFLDLVGAFEPGLVEIGVEKGFLAAKAFEGEGEKLALLLEDEKGWDILGVVYEICAFGLEMFEIAAALVPAALADGEDIVGKGAKGAGGHQAADGQGRVRVSTGKMGEDEDRKAEGSL